ncbi:hypothetical protein GJT83_00865 [Enterobacteriaceae endosymbiont of Plateumaris pusilla]|uniref:peptidylprolyl isomerase n=1 Tax=Enterobacteriaceae endosymbiont of Plateumaris pusilla TaxID=2675795 RepID=UPI001448C6B7|nr:peptidylprolyl isomerase [Enterobacteriaceae endosymbiont of Plateumaris pusilla]QJC29466.1 hypothetical protein GJT83_00865 [Enterobacteriaceae endosymbiont of Plateumaris pusilla]
MRIKKLVFIITLFSFLYYSNVYASFKNIDQVGIIINNDMITKKDIFNLMNLFDNQKNKYLLNDFNIINQEFIKNLFLNNIFLQISKNYNIYIPDNNINNIIQNTIKNFNVNMNIFNKELINNKISYEEYYNFIKRELIINLIKFEEIKNKIIIFDEEIDSLKNLFSIENKNTIKYDITIFYIPINKNLLKNDFNKKLFLTKILINKLKNINFLSCNKKNVDFYNKNNIQKQDLGWKSKDLLPDKFINYLNSVKVKDIIGPIYLDSGFYLLRINDLKIKNNLQKKFLIKYIFIKKNNLTKKFLINKIKNIRDLIINNQIKFEQAINLFSKENKLIQSKSNNKLISLEYFSFNIQNIINKLKINEISPIIEQPDGFYLIKLIKIKDFSKKNHFFKKKAKEIIMEERFVLELNHWFFTYLNGVYINNMLNNNKKY